MSNEYVGIDFDQWVNDNNPPIESNYQKAFWDWIEQIRRLSQFLGPRKGAGERIFRSNASGPRTPHPERVVLRVVGAISYETPPPCESITMPVVFIETGRFSAYLAYWFSVEPFLPSYIVSVDKRSITGDDHEYTLDDVVSYETWRNEMTDTAYTNEHHTLDLFNRMKDKVVCDQNAQKAPPFCLDPEKLFYGDPNEKTVFTFEELHTALSEGDQSFLAQKPILFSMWSYEGLYSALTTLQRISGKIR